MKKIWISILLLILLLSGCYQKGTVRDTNLFEPYYIAHANVPYADKLNDSQFDRVSELAKDQYGRRYFSYQTYSTILQADIEIHIISQGVMGDNVFYYPDNCYMIRLEKDAVFSDEEIAAFKERNDWNFSLQEDKMCSAPRNNRTDIVYEETLHAAVLKYLDLDSSYGVVTNGLEHNDTKNQQIFVVCVFSLDKDGKKSGENEFYLIVYKNDSSDPIQDCLPMEYSLNCQEAIRDFRESLIGFRSKA